ncbi:MAG: sporulation protein YtfJ [Ruminococcaceae bacterium]|nr:sporulation protein YtfJ [Oscillospiraceae bacterium]
MSKKITEILNESMSSIRSMVDANTVVGSPIQVMPEVTLIPISKITMSLASGGADFAAKEATAGSFGGGTGCSVKVVPVAMIVIQGERVRMLPINEPASTAAERAVEQLPALVDKVSDLIRGRNTDISDI